MEAIPKKGLQADYGDSRLDLFAVDLLCLTQN
jgi:hypothetical protein